MLKSNVTIVSLCWLKIFLVFSRRLQGSGFLVNVFFFGNQIFLWARFDLLNVSVSCTLSGWNQTEKKMLNEWYFTTWAVSDERILFFFVALFAALTLYADLWICIMDSSLSQDCSVAIHLFFKPQFRFLPWHWSEFRSHVFVNLFQKIFEDLNKWISFRWNSQNL